ncbi:conserved hypothetical protein [Sporisorium reilianum SRZ2]|uniref:Uncharacterized protein n=1 Tax=Sporisorium reilianum (strain SRZ2) TaxID=999809 RepID=E6ZS05_SPORE|nr:conserved hypothetical protein [Sporisorium reilianum SRZ2]
MACCNSAAARLPSPFHRLTRPSAAAAAAAGARAKRSAGTLPPAFLVPRVHTQPFSVQSARLAVARTVKSTSSTNSAQNVRGALRRLGQGSKWSSQAPTADRGAAPRSATATPPPKRLSWGRDSADSSKRTRSSDRQRGHERGFRLRAKALCDHLQNAIRDIDGSAKASPALQAQTDAAVEQALAHFEAEMKALRVMIKSKDVLVDPDNAWKSASRIKTPCNAAIRLCLKTGKHERALKLLNQMKKDGIFPNAATYNVIINALTRALVAQTDSASSPRNTQDLLERKEAKRIREVYMDLEKLWKQSFPRYFQRAGAPRSREASPLDVDDFHNLTDQLRRNLVSQQASIHEAREYPQVLTAAIGSYANFLRQIDAKDELESLFDRLFPAALLDSMAKGLASDASPQDKLELANRKLSDWLPLGDKTTFSVFFGNADNEDPGADRLAMLTRVWTRLATLMDLERHELLSSSSSVDEKRTSDAKRAADGVRDEPDAPRFVPDNQCMVDLLKRVQILPDADPAPELRLGLEILSKVYALDLEASADNIIRDPQMSNVVEAFGPEHYLRKDVDALDQATAPLSELRDPDVAACVFRLLVNAEAWESCIALFNYLWARNHAEHANAGLQADNVTALLSDTAVFGSTLRPTFAMRLLWYFVELGDPMGARVVIEAMKRAAGGATSQRFEAHEGANRRARRSAKLDEDRSHRASSALEWKPADICYARAMRANLLAAIKGPQGLTALQLQSASSSGSTETADSAEYDAWTEAKKLFAEWSDLRDADSRSSSTRRARHDDLSHVHADTMRSLLLHIARVCAKQRANQAPEVAREALRLLDERVGLERLVDERKQLESNSKKDTAAVRHDFYTLAHLSKVIAIALDTSEQSFAPKAEVELWKRVKKTIPAASASDESEARSPSQQRQREMLDRATGGNRLLLSKDDYLELEAEVDDDEAFEMDEERYGNRGGGSYRMQRRSRHVEQEIERFVRGSSL